MKEVLKMKLIRRITAIAVGLSLMNITACGAQAGEGVRVTDLSLTVDSIVKSSGISATDTNYSPKALFKAKQGLESPLLTNIFCADPTAVEYNGRLMSTARTTISSTSKRAIRTTPMSA